MDRSFIAEYEVGIERLPHAVAGLSREELLAYPVPGTWNIQQIVLHMMDSELVGSDRIKRIIAMKRPTLMAYDESEYAQRLGYERLNLAGALQLFQLNRQMTAAILRGLPDEVFERVGLHSERGEVRLGPYVAEYNEHLEHHLGFIRQKRALLGKPLAI